jgi:hypothetical protein
MADPKPKAGGVPPPEKEAPVEKSQRERFIEAASEAGVTDETLPKALEKIAPPKRK